MNLLDLNWTHNIKKFEFGPIKFGKILFDIEGFYTDENKRFKVYDNNKLLVDNITVRFKTNTIRCNNENREEKVDIYLISFDEKYYLKRKYFKFVIVNEYLKTKEVNADIIKFDIDRFSSYRIANWADVFEDPDSPIYKDNDYDELDPR